MKALFIGLGSIGQRHLRNLLAVSERPLELMAVRRMHSVPLLDAQMQVVGAGDQLTAHYGIKEFGSLKEALKQRPDIVFVCNPSIFHISDAYESLGAGASVFVEKPLASSWLGVEDILKAADMGKIMVGFQFRFHPQLKSIRELIKAGKLGNIVGATFINSEYLPHWHRYEDYRQSYAARSDLGGGALLTQIHELDLAQWFFGVPHTVYAVGGHLSDLEVDVEDSATVILSCGSKDRSFPVSIHLDYLGYPAERSISIVGDRGKVYWNQHSGELIVSMLDEQQVYTHPLPQGFERNHMFLEQVRHLLDFVNDRCEPIVSVAEAAISLQIALAAKKSMNCGQHILLG